MLYSHLYIDPLHKELVSLVGGGGKTTALFHLARELKDQGCKVLVTTTTAIYYPNQGLYDFISIGPESPRARIGITVWGSRVNADNKLIGIAPELVDHVFNSQQYDHILVEADGARGNPVKAPAQHEPVIPSASTKCIGVIGLTCLGQRVADVVHRPLLWQELTGSASEDRVNKSDLLVLIKSNNGLFKNAPPASERYLILNQAGSPTLIAEGELILKEAANQGVLLDGGLITDLHTGVYQSYPNPGFITGVIMASGNSKRFPGNKLLEDFQGRSLVEWVIRAAAASDLKETVVVYQHPEVKSIAEKYGTTAVYNPQADHGQSQAVKLGVKAASPAAQGIMFLTGDQPLITANYINQVIYSFDNQQYLAVQSLYQEIEGHPVLFSSKLRPDLLNLSGDVGGRMILKNLPEKQVKKVRFNDLYIGMDIDTIEDYQRLLKVTL